MNFDCPTMQVAQLEYMRGEEPPLGNGYCPDCMRALPILAKSALALLYPDWNWETI
jgi:hypothetical protein